MRVVLIFSFNCQQESDKAYYVSHRVKLMLGISHRWTHMAQMTRAKNVTKGNVKKRSALVPFLHLTAFLCLLCDFAWMDCRFVSLLNQSRSGYCISHPMEDWMPLFTEACKAGLAAAAPFLYPSLPFLLFPSLSVTHSYSGLTEAFLPIRPDQANDCHYCAKKVITPSRSVDTHGTNWTIHCPH